MVRVNEPLQAQEQGLTTIPSDDGRIVAWNGNSRRINSVVRPALEQARAMKRVDEMPTHRAKLDGGFEVCVCKPAMYWTMPL